MQVFHVGRYRYPMTTEMKSQYSNPKGKKGSVKSTRALKSSSKSSPTKKDFVPGNIMISKDGNVEPITTDSLHKVIEGEVDESARAEKVSSPMSVTAGIASPEMDKKKRYNNHS
jgi:hypothetical protein